MLPERAEPCRCSDDREPVGEKDRDGVWRCIHCGHKIAGAPHERPERHDPLAGLQLRDAFQNNGAVAL